MVVVVAPDPSALDYWIHREALLDKIRGFDLRINASVGL